MARCPEGGELCFVRLNALWDGLCGLAILERAEVEASYQLSLVQTLIYTGRELTGRLTL